MIERFLADVVVCFHFLFVVFVLAGGVLVLRWPRLMWLHLPCVAWGSVIEIGGWICPLTYLENHLRQKGFEAGYATSFVEHYIWPLIYPDVWFPGGFPSWGFMVIGGGVLVINAMLYARIWRRRGKGVDLGGSTPLGRDRIQEQGEALQ